MLVWEGSQYMGRLGRLLLRSRFACRESAGTIDLWNLYRDRFRSFAGGSRRRRHQTARPDRAITARPSPIATAYYTFVSVPPGAYEFTVTAPGFETYKQTGIAILGGDKINVNVDA